MKKLIYILLLASKSTLALAQPIASVDIYGTNTLSSKMITTEYQQEINEIGRTAQLGSISAKAVEKVTAGIKSRGKYAYVGISPIMYQHDPVTHITIDVVEKNDRHRLAYFLPTPQHDITDPQHLIAQWREYEKIGFDIVFKTHQFPSFKKCPAQHCLFGFDHPSLAKFEHAFSKADNYKNELISVARNDKNESKRAAAIYLLAHIKNNHELITLLIPSIRDSSSLVRNNTMRVLGAVLSQKNKEYHFPISAIVTALDYPSTTDRNKALYVISSLAEKPEHANYIKVHAGRYLINTLKLEQPNNHDFSYLILKKISGKNYGERDYNAWEKWLA